MPDIKSALIKITVSIVATALVCPSALAIQNSVDLIASNSSNNENEKLKVQIAEHQLPRSFGQAKYTTDW